MRFVSQEADVRHPFAFQCPLVLFVLYIYFFCYITRNGIKGRAISRATCQCPNSQEHSDNKFTTKSQSQLICYGKHKSFGYKKKS
jgi:hypothetical protein